MWLVSARAGVARRARPRRRAEQGACHRSTRAVAQQIAKVLAHRVAMPEVVIAGEQAVKQAQVFRARRDDGHRQWAQVAPRTPDRIGRRRHDRHVTIPRPIRRRAATRRQADVAGPFPCQQPRARRHLCGPALRMAPVPAPAEFFAQAGPAPRGWLGQQIADQTEIRAAHLAPLQNHDACHGSQSTANTPAESSEKLFCCARGGEATLLSTVAPWWGYLSRYLRSASLSRLHVVGVDVVLVSDNQQASGDDRVAPGRQAALLRQ